MLGVLLTEDLTPDHSAILKELNSKDVASLATHFLSTILSRQQIPLKKQSLLMLETGC